MESTAECSKFEEDIVAGGGESGQLALEVGVAGREAFVCKEERLVVDVRG